MLLLGLGLMGLAGVRRKFKKSTLAEPEMALFLDLRRGGYYGDDSLGDL